jgi:hypothetical protein
MALVCEDLSRYGIVLIPPSEDRATLVNRAEIAIAHIAYVWSFRRPGGRITTSSRMPGTQPSLLLPFTMGSLTVPSLKRHTYWNSIFPRSQRLLTAAGECIGDNTDVSTPSEDERWCGGRFRISSHPRYDPDAEPVKLTLDRVFFTDEGFAGPNQLGSWDRFVAARETHLNCALQARRAAVAPDAQADFFYRWQKLSGLTGDEPCRSSVLPPPRPPHYRPNSVDHEDIRRYQQETVARKVLGMRDNLGAEAAILAIAAWQDRPGPELHKL